MRLYGLIDYLYGAELAVLDPEFVAWPPQGYAASANQVTIGYAPEGMAAGLTDRFYVSDMTLTSANYATEGALAAVNSDPVATDVVLTGLLPNRDYFVFGVRFNGETPTGVYSNLQTIRTLRVAIPFTTPSSTRTSDWSTDKFNDWFRYQSDLPRALVSRSSDGEMGNYVRLAGRENPYYDQEIEGSVPYSFYNSLDGLKFVSPRHDWSIEIPVRMPVQWGGAQQWQVGINSGDQAIVAVETRTAHSTGAGTEVLGGSNLTDVTLIGPDSRLWATCYAQKSDGTANLAQGGTTSWRLSPTSEPEHSKWHIPLDAKTLIRFDYNATSYELKIYINDVLVCTLGDIHNPPTNRKKFPHGHYSLPVTFFIRGQALQPNSPFYCDIGAVKITTACPYHYAGYAANTGHWGSHGHHTDTGVLLDDPAKHTLNNLRYWTAVFSGGARFSTTLPSGFTVPDTATASDGFILGGSTGTYTNTDPIPAKTLPVDYSGTVKVLGYSFQGLAQRGTIQGRLLSSGSAITAYAAVAGVIESSLVAVNVDAADIQAELLLQYDGTTVDALAYNDSVYTNKAPDTPSLFAGFEVYFTPPPLTIEGINGGTISYTTYDPEGRTYELAYSLNNGASYTVERTESPGAYTLTLSGLAEGTYQVRLRITPLTGDTTPVESEMVEMVVSVNAVNQSQAKQTTSISALNIYNPSLSFLPVSIESTTLSSAVIAYGTQQLGAEQTQQIQSSSLVGSLNFIGTVASTQVEQSTATNATLFITGSVDESQKAATQLIVSVQSFDGNSVTSQVKQVSDVIAEQAFSGTVVELQTKQTENITSIQTITGSVNQSQVKAVQALEGFSSLPTIAFSQQPIASNGVIYYGTQDLFAGFEGVVVQLTAQQQQIVNASLGFTASIAQSQKTASQDAAGSLNFTGAITEAQPVAQQVIIGDLGVSGLNQAQVAQSQVSVATLSFIGALSSVQVQQMQSLAQIVALAKLRVTVSDPLALSISVRDPLAFNISVRDPLGLKISVS